MLIKAEASHFALLLGGAVPPPRAFVHDSEIAAPQVLQMLADLAASILTHFASAAWMIVEAGEVVRLLSAVRPPSAGELHIGYGVGPSRRRRGIAGRAVKDVVAWAAADARIVRITAETSVDNLPSQRVLGVNGFRITGTL